MKVLVLYLFQRNVCFWIRLIWIRCCHFFLCWLDKYICFFILFCLATFWFLLEILEKGSIFDRTVQPVFTSLDMTSNHLCLIFTAVCFGCWASSTGPIQKQTNTHRQNTTDASKQIWHTQKKFDTFERK